MQQAVACELSCSYNDISAAFARDVVLPAVQANTSLRKLHCTSWLVGGESKPDINELVQAEQLVRDRSA